VLSGVPHTVDLNNAPSGQPPAAAQQLDAVVCQPAHLPRVGVIGDHEVTPGERRLDIDLGACGGIARAMHRLARPQQRL